MFLRLSTILAAALLVPALVPARAAAQQSPAAQASSDTAPAPAFAALVAQAADARNQGNLPQAVQLYSQALQLNPGWAPGWWYIGLLSYSANQYSQAIDAFSHYIQFMPKAAPAYALRGLCEYGTADYDSALNDIQQAVSLGAANNSRNGEILLFHEAILLTRASRYVEAMGVFQKLAATAPSDPHLLTAIGLAGLRIPILPAQASPQQQQEALAAGQAAWPYLSKHKNDPQGFDTLFATYPALVNAHYFYAYLLFGHDPANAIAPLREELQLDPNNVAALMLMAWCQILDGHDYTALPYARQAVQLDPSLFLAQLDLGRALVGSGYVAEGLPHLLKAQQLQPGNLEVHIGLAIAYAKSSQPSLARSERLKALAVADRAPLYGMR
jgi:tetratricopeptide (TPR) repeat protein